MQNLLALLDLLIKMENLNKEIEECEKVLHGLLFDQSGSTASPGNVRKFKAIIEAAQEKLIKDLGADPKDLGFDISQYDVPIADLEAVGVPPSGLKWQSFYSRKNGGGSALAELGYRGTLKTKEGILAIVRLPQVESADESAAA